MVSLRSTLRGELIHSKSLLREYVCAVLTEGGVVLPSKTEMNSAWEVFKDWLFNDKKAWIKFRRARRRKDDFFAARTNIKKIPLSKVDIFADWGRRIKGARLQRPIVVIKVGGRYKVLDGQHRTLTLKEKGETHVVAAVIDL